MPLVERTYRKTIESGTYCGFRSGCFEAPQPTAVTTQNKRIHAAPTSDPTQKYKVTKLK
jgi:hypothetical protein